MKIHRCRACACGKSTPHLVEALGVGTLKAEDRLLLVADCEDGTAAIVARAEPGEEFFGELFDDPPLLRTRVLGLGDQDMVYAAVELVVHPGGIVVLQEIDGLCDEIVVVEKPARKLLRLVVANGSAGERKQRTRPLARHGGAALIQKIVQPIALGGEAHEQRRVLRARGGAAEAAVGARLALIGEEYGETQAERARRGGRERLAALGRIAAERDKGDCDRRPFRTRQLLAPQ